MALSNWVEPAAREYDTRLEANDDQLQYVLTKSGGRHSYGTARASARACLDLTVLWAPPAETPLCWL